MKVYGVLYIHIDKAEYSEILGIYKTKDSAVKNLLEKANYREKDGQLTQYMEYTNEYESYEFLYNKIMKENKLIDVDIYEIYEHELED